MIGAADGHVVHGLEVSEPLLALARERSREAKLDIDFRLGTAHCIAMARHIQLTFCLLG